MPFGYFNAYAHAATRNDLDLIVHTGDYLYEYGLGVYPSKEQSLAGRLVAPDHEMIALADYRLRYASYRKDPNLQRLHQLFPMIAMWDDHEFTNDAPKTGAQNHDSNEGDWAVRKRAAPSGKSGHSSASWAVSNLRRRQVTGLIPTHLRSSSFA